MAPGTSREVKREIETGILVQGSCWSERPERKIQSNPVSVFWNGTRGAVAASRMKEGVGLEQETDALHGILCTEHERAGFATSLSRSVVAVWGELARWSAAGSTCGNA